jgi:DNA-directed RNA polymerase subunit H (RpoH/RPB5)
MGVARVKFKVLVRNQISDRGIFLNKEEGPEITKALDLPKTELPNILGNYSQTQDAQVTAELFIIERIIEIPEKFPG